jgi:protein TonB
MIGFRSFGLSLPGLPAGVLAFNDRLGVSVFGSVLVHMVLIMGVSFGFPKWQDLKGLPTLEITLVQTQSSLAPKEAEFLANANQDGGGNSDRPDIARNPLPVREVSDSRQRFAFLQRAPQSRVESPREVTDLMVQPHADWQAKTRDPRPERKEQQTEPLNLALLEREQRAERARLNAEISRNWQEFQQRPRRKFLNARTQEYKYAAYMDAWRAKVERIGNLNYPEEAKRRHLTGSLVLDVALNSDGSVNGITVRRSSGHKLLDDAAVRIVEISAPFAPFTPDIRAETDLLHITRTWKFNETLSAEN